MLKDLRYIIKRIIIGVAIAIIVFLLKSEVFALSWDFSVIKEQLFVWNDFKHTSLDARSNDTNITRQLDFTTPFTNSSNHHFAVFTLTGGIVVRYLDNVSSVYNFDMFGNYVNRINLVSDNAAWSTCELQNNLLVCPISPGAHYTSLWFFLNGAVSSASNGTTVHLDFTVNNAVDLYDSLLFNFSNGQDQTNQKLDEINSSIQSQTQDQQDNSDANVDVSNMGGITGLLPAGPVDSLLSLPLTLINLLITGTSGSCTPFTFTFVFGEQFTLPCFDSFWNQVPMSLLIFLSDLPAVYIFIQWSKSIYKRVERAVSFESSVEDEWGGV